MPNTTKTKATQKRLDAAVSAFHARYSSPDQYGERRWFDSLYPALLRQTDYTALVNGFVGEEGEVVEEILKGRGEGVELEVWDGFWREGRDNEGTEVGRVKCYKRVRVEDDNGDDGKVRSMLPFPTPVKCKNGLLSHWNMDAASVLAACVLDVRPGDRVLDLCAAPGGKSVVLAQCLWPQTHTSDQHDNSRSCLHTNEPDTNRNKRLLANLQSYIPASLFESRQVKILKLDASSKDVLSSLPCGIGPDNGRYDKILVDAPCSSERHIVHAHTKATSAGQISEEMLNWKASHSITLAKTQVGLLTTAIKALGIGGRILYATCALSHEENDGVVERVLEYVKKERKKSKSTNNTEWQWNIELDMGSEGIGIDGIDKVLNEMTEQTKYGRIALPDNGGYGPLYFSVIKKIKMKAVKKVDGNKLDKRPTSSGVLDTTIDSPGSLNVNTSD